MNGPQQTASPTKNYFPITQAEFDRLWDLEKEEKEKSTQEAHKIDYFSLFNQRKYEEAFAYLYLNSHNCGRAKIFLAQYYEYGLGKIYKDIKSANNLYLSVLSNNYDNYLIKEAEEGYERTLKILKSTIKIDVTDLHEVGKFKKAPRSDAENTLFAVIGVGWASFTQKKYKDAFNHIYLRSLNNCYPSRFLLAEYYEYGLGSTAKDFKVAKDLYSSVMLNCDNELLKRKAEEGHARMSNI
jgi:hypothetical protein